MAIYGESLTIQYVAWDTTNNAPKTGDAANHTLRWVKDGTAAAPTNSPSEVDATNAPGVYKLTLTASETQCWVGTLCGKSSSSGVVVMPITLTFERLPAAAPGDTNGLPIIGSDPLTKLDVNVSTRLATLAYTAPDNASIAAIKSQTDKLQFDSNNYVYAVGIGGGGGVQVVVQPLTASVQRTDGAGGVISGWTYARLVASWNVKDVDLSGHDLRLILFAPNDPLTSVAEYSTASSEITITYNAPDSLVQINGPDTKTPPVGKYGYVLRDQTTDTVLVSGTCLIHAAPDAS